MPTAKLPAVPESMVNHAREVLGGEYAPPPGVDLSGVETVLDIGANVGAFTAWALACFPAAHVTAVEPIPENVSMFLENVPAQPRVTLHEAAVWPGAMSTITMRRGLYNCGEASIFDLGEQSDEVLEVPCLSPSRLPAAHFIKIDAEGAETEILASLDTSQAKVIALEWHHWKARAAIIDMLTGRGFACVTDRSTMPQRGILIFERRRAVPPITSAPARKIFLAIPVYGGMEALFVHCLLATVQQLAHRQPKPFDLHIQFKAGDSLIPRARNQLAAEFLKSDCTHLLFLDSDLIWGLDQVEKMLSHDEAIVCGLYPKKQAELKWVCNIIEGEVPDSRGLHPVKYAGTGCMLIQRYVLESMIAAHPEIAFGADDGEKAGGWDFFAVGPRLDPVSGYVRYLSEDWFFCQRARDLGYTVHMDTHVVCRHIGQMIYPLADPFAPADAPIDSLSRP